MTTRFFLIQFDHHKALCIGTVLCWNTIFIRANPSTTVGMIRPLDRQVIGIDTVSVFWRPNPIAERATCKPACLQEKPRRHLASSLSCIQSQNVTMAGFPLSIRQLVNCYFSSSLTPRHPSFMCFTTCKMTLQVSRRSVVICTCSV